jgi:RimJ/RimL family protein N-acetyltransferase
LNLIFDQAERVAAYVSEKIGAPCSGPLVAVGLSQDGQTLCGGAVFNNWTGANIELGFACDVPLTRGLLKAFNHYVFIQLKATRCTAITKRSNKRTRKILERVGFLFEGVSPKYFGPNKSQDGFRYVLYPEALNRYVRL